MIGCIKSRWQQNFYLDVYRMRFGGKIWLTLPEPEMTFPDMWFPRPEIMTDFLKLDDLLLHTVRIEALTRWTDTWCWILKRYRVSISSFFTNYVVGMHIFLQIWPLPFCNATIAYTFLQFKSVVYMWRFFNAWSGDLRDVMHEVLKNLRVSFVCLSVIYKS